MCDTIVATPLSAAQRIMLFGKNSDRQRNEAQAVEYFPRADHSDGTQLRCTYISIPQASHTHAVLLCRPFWIWGAEMGANEHGVVIGNEGLHARSPAPEQPALTGMDLLRLALERSATAAEAVQIVTQLLEQHGQGGNCGHLVPNFYNNGFLIADASEAFVLETVGREWLLERASAVRSMSNTYSIDESLANPNREHIGYAKSRRARSHELMAALDGRLEVADMMRVLRDHGPDAASHWHPQHAPTVTVCMHAAGEERAGQTVGSMVSELHEKDAVHWVTGTSAPCISIYKPVLMDTPPPPEQLPTDRFDPTTLWWRHERFHRAALLRDLGSFVEEIAPERDALEAKFRSRVAAVRRGGCPADRANVIAACWRDADELTRRWEHRLAQLPVRDRGEYEKAWSVLNQLAGLREGSG